MAFLAKDYEVSDSPLGDRKWGVLAHVSDDVREKILLAGSGEIQRHAEHIEMKIKQIKKTKKSPLPMGF